MENTLTETISIKFDGKLFETDLDLRDITFFSRKVSNIIDKSYLGCTGKYTKNNDLRKKYSIQTKKIKHSSLFFELLIDYGQYLAPVLMSQPLTIPDIIEIAINTIKDLGNKAPTEKSKVTINATNSTIYTAIIDIEGGKNNIEIPLPVYNSMLQIDSDIKDISNKFEKEEISLFSFNDKDIITRKDIKDINIGLKHIEKLKEEKIDVPSKAEVIVQEFNKLNMTGKAQIVNIDLWGVEHREIVDIEIPITFENQIINSLRGEKLILNFLPIIENQISKKVLKKMLIVN